VYGININKKKENKNLMEPVQVHIDNYVDVLEEEAARRAITLAALFTEVVEREGKRLFYVRRSLQPKAAKIKKPVGRPRKEKVLVQAGAASVYI